MRKILAGIFMLGMLAVTSRANPIIDGLVFVDFLGPNAIALNGREAVASGALQELHLGSSWTGQGFELGIISDAAVLPWLELSLVKDGSTLWNVVYSNLPTLPTGQLDSLGRSASTVYGPLIQEFPAGDSYLKVEAPVDLAGSWFAYPSTDSQGNSQSGIGVRIWGAEYCPPTTVPDAGSTVWLMLTAIVLIAAAHSRVVSRVRVCSVRA